MVSFYEYKKVRISNYKITAFFESAVDWVSRMDIAVGGFRFTRVNPFGRDVFSDLDFITNVTRSQSTSKPLLSLSQLWEPASLLSANLILPNFNS